MTSDSSSSDQGAAGPDSGSAEDHPPVKRKRSMDVGWATALVALATVVSASITLAGTYLVKPASSGAKPASTASKSAEGPTSVTITPPESGTIHHLDSYSGKVYNLRLGQLVWTFNQSVARKTGSISPVTYPDSGPCVVNYSKRTWACDNVYVGSTNDTGMYRVCAAILSSSDAFAVVDLLRNTLANKKANPSFIRYTWSGGLT